MPGSGQRRQITFGGQVVQRTPASRTSDGKLPFWLADVVERRGHRNLGERIVATLPLRRALGNAEREEDPLAKPRGERYFLANVVCMLTDRVRSVLEWRPVEPIDFAAKDAAAQTSLGIPLLPQGRRGERDVAQ